MLAREMGVLKMGAVALDGARINVHASRHSARSYEHAAKIEARLQAEMAELMARADAADRADLPDGMSIPEELARREQRLAEIARARAIIEARAKGRHAREQAEYDAGMAAREAKITATGKEPGGKPPVPPLEGSGPTDQVTLTGEESRIMPMPGCGFEWCTNAQAAVAVGRLLVVTNDVVQATNDKQRLQPMLGSTLHAARGTGRGRNAAGRPWVFQRGQCAGLGGRGDRSPDRDGTAAARSPTGRTFGPRCRRRRRTRRRSRRWRIA